MTGTTTMNIHVTDQNDNVPQPAVYNVEMCVSDNRTTTNITASDLDGEPFGGPFTFELLGDFERKWKLNPSYGKKNQTILQCSKIEQILQTNKNNDNHLEIISHRVHSWPREGARCVCRRTHNKS